MTGLIGAGQSHNSWSLTLDNYIICSNDHIFQHNKFNEKDNDFDKLYDHVFAKVRIAIDGLVFFSSHYRFVVEISPVSLKKRKPGVKVLRSNDRPKYTLLKPNEIRIAMGLPEQLTNRTGSPKTPHPRRRHLRILRSERFGENQGKPIEVAATWVCPIEAVRGNKRYKVRLDIW